jgi:sugar phosphate isomerase/epimerase
VLALYRIGYRTASFKGQSLTEAFQALGTLGYDCVELCLEREELDPTTLCSETAEELVASAQRAGVRIHSLSYHGEGKEWPHHSERQLAAVRVAPWFGASVVVINTPSASAGVPCEAVSEHLCEVARVAEEVGVQIAVEPEPGLVIANVADAVRLTESCPSHALALNLDVGHAFLTETDFPDGLEALAGRIAHVHFEDMPAGEHRHLVPGEGDMPLVDTVVVLWKAGFRGVLTIDLFGPFDDPADLARRALRATRRILREAVHHVRAGL